MLIYGMSSETAQSLHNGGMENYRTSEGRTIYIDYRGSVKDTLNDILGGLRSYGTYIGCNDIQYFEYCTQKDTIYVRFDDDVVWMEQDAAKKLVEYRLNNPEYFLVFGNTVNNALCDFLHKKTNILDINDEIEYECMGKITWNAPVVAEKKHRAFLANYENNKVTGYYFTDHLLKDYERCSINVISWFGEKFAEFNGIVGTSEEQWLACVKPFLDKTPNVIFGNAIFVHYAFGPQRQHLTKTNVLDCYRNINPFFQDTILHD